MQIDRAAERERTTILDAAYRCLGDTGDRPIRMSAILACAGLSSRAFYRHFSSKDDLILALVTHKYEGLAARLDGIAARAVGGPADQLTAWIQTAFEVTLDPQHRIHLAVVDSDEVRAAKGYGEARQRWYAERERSLIQILSRGQFDGSLPLADPETDAMAISALVSRIIAAQKADDSDAAAYARSRATDFVLRAVGARNR